MKWVGCNSRLKIEFARRNQKKERKEENFNVQIDYSSLKDRLDKQSGDVRKKFTKKIESMV